MAYAEKIKSVAGDYWRGKFKGPEGKYVSVRDGGRFVDDDDVWHGSSGDGGSGSQAFGLCR